MSDSGYIAEQEADATQRILERQAQVHSDRYMNHDQSRFVGIQGKCVQCGQIFYPLTLQAIANHQFETGHKWQTTIGKEYK